MTYRPLILLFASLAFSVVGCSSKTDLSGKVTYKGRPLVWGSVTLLDSRGEYFVVEIGSNGQYLVPGLLAGEYKVGITCPKPPAANDPRASKANKSNRRDKGNENQSSDNDSRPIPRLDEWFPIPDKYKDPASSGLRIIVAKGLASDIVLD